MSDRNGWVAGIVTVVIIILVIFGLASTSKNNAEQLQAEKIAAVQQVTNDIDSKYTELSETATKMMSDIDNECVWLSDNISKSVGEYCANALTNYAYINSAGWSADSVKYNEQDTYGEILTVIVDEANSQYASLLEATQSASDTMDDECGWLYDNISPTVAGYCNETTAEFRHSNFNSEPFTVDDYSSYFADSSD